MSHFFHVKFFETLHTLISRIFLAIKNARPDVELYGYMDLMQKKFNASAPLTPPKPKDCAIIMYTSGSTGKYFDFTKKMELF